MGLAGLSSTLIPGALALAQTPTPAAKPGAAPTAAPVDTSTAKKEEISEEAKALAQVIRKRYGKHLSDEEIGRIAKDLDGDLKTLPRLHAVKLANGDEPDFTFRA